MVSVTPVNSQRSTTFGGRYKLPISTEDCTIFEKHVAPLFQAMRKEPIRAYKTTSHLYVYTGSHDVDKFNAIRPNTNTETRYKEAVRGILSGKVLEQGYGAQATQFAQNAIKYPLKELANLKDLIRNIILQ